MQASPAPKQASTGPSFSNPPVVESVLGIQFGELKGFNTTHFGLFYQEITDRYPVVEIQPRLEPIIESFPVRVMVPRFKLATTPRTERVLFKDAEDASELVQIQPDRFGFNWRKPGEKEALYPRYPENSRRCLEEFRRFVEFCNDRGLGEPKPNLCEVVYVNHIWPEPELSVVDLFARVFSGLAWCDGEVVGTPELATFNRVFRMQDDRGRLYAEASMAHHKERGDFILLKMTGRALHTEKQSVEESLGVAHDWVVRGFVDLTDPAIRTKQWGQTS